MPLSFILFEPFLYSTYTKVYTTLQQHLIFYRCSPAEALGQGVRQLLRATISSILNDLRQKTNNFLFAQQARTFAFDVGLLALCFYPYINLSLFPCSVLQRLELTPTHDLIALAGPELVLSDPLSQLILEHVPS